MDAKSLKEITSDLSLLYVEDDESLRTETAKLFGHLFNSVKTAENGKDGLEKLSQGSFDLIITDINMPVMNGIELCRSIRKTNNDITIIITSAHDESKYLMELIDIGIDKFILKPIDMQKMISTLLQTCTHIRNTKLIKKYKKEIEESNIQLKESNHDLEILVKILDKKIEQLHTKEKREIRPNTIDDAIHTPKAIPPSTKNEKGLFIYNDYVLKSDINDLEKLESDINNESAILAHKIKIEEQNIVNLAIIFSKYGKIINNYPIFKDLGNNIKKLGVCLEQSSHVFIDNSNDIMILLESFLYVLRKWRKSIFTDGIKNPHIYETSMNNDIETIILILQDDKESIENDFF